MEYLLLTLICLPKFSIIGFESVSQGIRIDDVIVLILFLRICTQVRFDISHIYIFILITIVSIIGLFNNDNDFLFLRLMSILRILEYIVIYYSAKLLLSKEQLNKLIKLIVVFEFIVVIFQYVTEPSIRPSGTTAGPWELGLVCSVCAIYLTSRLGFKNTIIYNSLMVIILILASARAQILAMMIIGLIVSYSRIRINYLLKIIIIIATLILSILAIYYVDYGYINFSRSINFVKDFYLDIFEDFINLRVAIKTNDYDINYYDPSLVSRVLQWEEYISTINQAKNIPFALLFGSGANSGGLILDGFYIKMLVDFGIVGLVFYIYFLIKGIFNSKYIYYTMLIAISSLTLDLFWASKFMYTLLISISYLNKTRYD